MTVKEIIKDYLKKNGFDGLANADVECGCGIDDLVSCGEDCCHCEPGYKIKDESGEYDYLITTKKPNKKFKKVVCLSCKGSGEVQQTDIDWDECRRCNGTGKV